MELLAKSFIERIKWIHWFELVLGKPVVFINRMDEQRAAEEEAKVLLLNENAEEPNGRFFTFYQKLQEQHDRTSLESGIFANEDQEGEGPTNASEGDQEPSGSMIVEVSAIACSADEPVDAARSEVVDGTAATAAVTISSDAPQASTDVQPAWTEATSPPASINQGHPRHRGSVRAAGPPSSHVGPVVSKEDPTASPQALSTQCLPSNAEAPYFDEGEGNETKIVFLGWVLVIHPCIPGGSVYTRVCVVESCWAHIGLSFDSAVLTFLRERDLDVEEDLCFCPSQVSRLRVKRSKRFGTLIVELYFEAEGAAALQGHPAMFSAAVTSTPVVLQFHDVDDLHGFVDVVSPLV